MTGLGYLYGPIRHPGGAQCQFADTSLQEFLTCDYYESGGHRCEKLEEHTDEHWWSDHTKIHEKRGNGYACSAFVEPVAAGAYKAMLQQKYDGIVAHYTEALAELDVEGILL